MIDFSSGPGALVHLTDETESFALAFYDKSIDDFKTSATCTSNV